MATFYHTNTKKVHKAFGGQRKYIKSDWIDSLTFSTSPTHLMLNAPLPQSLSRILFQHIQSTTFHSVCRCTELYILVTFFFVIYLCCPIKKIKCKF